MLLLRDFIEQGKQDFLVNNKYNPRKYPIDFSAAGINLCNFNSAINRKSENKEFVPEDEHKNDLIYSGLTYATWSQRLEFESIYANIDNEDQDKTSLPVHFCENTIASIKEYIKNLRGDESGYKYVCNGNSHIHISELKNRLLK